MFFKGVGTMMIKKIIYLVIFAFACALVAFASTYFLPQKWEAVATLRVGSVAGVPIESTLEFTDRLRSPATISQVFHLLGGGHGIDDEEVLITSTRISSIGSSIQLRVRAISPEVAIGVINTYLKVVTEQQNNLFDQQIDIVKRYGFFDKMSIFNMVEGNTWDNYHAKDAEALILTYPTRYSVMPAAFSKPVSPNRGLIAALGFFGAAGIGLLAIYKKND